MIARHNRRNRRGNQRSNGGFVTIEFVVGCAFLILPVAMLVLVLPTWSERQGMATTAAREAARTYVLTHDLTRAQAVVDDIAAHHQLAGDEMTVKIEGDSVTPGTSVRATVSIGVPITVIPLLHADGNAFTIDESHTEVVDIYRSQQ